ncbi:MAG: FAD-dependent thymidylate synthase [Acetobacter sp.]|nr:FAD-dependent thymidylate synthase [Acetobacter sp.]
MEDKAIRFITPSASLVRENSLFKQIEAAGRVCYKSEDKITEDSAEKFVRMLCKRGHTAATEAGTLYFTYPQGIANSGDYDILYSPFSHVEYDDDWAYVTTNFRVVFEIFEKDFDKTMNYISKHAVEPTDKHELRHTLRIICDRGVSHELVRHRVFSFAQESTRYVRYGDKQEFKFIIPSWWADKMVDGQYSLEHTLFTESCKNAADSYDNMLRMGMTAQQARALLPNAVKTEVVMTGTFYQWIGFLKLRLAKDAHPDMQIVAKHIYDVLVDVSTAREHDMLVKELGL